ncbi:MAG: diguanylate cyclase [Fidelibacterota bacterium]|nr:MAG: diguanylate cyclase [Candidatus Neomarinimicrobiota bacterium]
MSKSGTQSRRQTSNRERLTVLVYDDDEAYRKLIRSILGQSRKVEFNILEVRNSRQMGTALKRHIPDVYILDLELKGKSGMDWLREITEKDIAPVVIVTGSGNEQTAVEAMKSGAYDYIPKAYLTYDLIFKSLLNVREKWELLRERERLQKELTHMAMYDGLTDILSRHALLEQAEVERQRTKRYKRDLSLLMIDIDHFKKVNDTYGHITGDLVLKEVAQNLKKQTRRSDFVGRYGGEEFLIILPETSIGKALVLAEKLRRRVSELAIPIDGKVLKDTTVSIGVAEYKDDSNIDEFINRSDKWLYAAKENGRNQVQPQSGKNDH